MGVTVCLLNQKGGVGKTSCTHHLSGALAKAGRRVLLVDNDPQASLTQGFWGPEAMRGIKATASVAALYDPDFGAIPEAMIRPTGFDGIHIIPGSVHLTPYNMTPPATWAESERGIADFLAEVREDFDVILVDCAPNLHLCSWAALTASDAVVVPLQAEDYGAQGLGPVQEAMAAVRAHSNPGLELLGFLLTMFDKRLGIHLAYEGQLRTLYGESVFSTPFPLAKDFKEAVAARQPITSYKPRSAAARATVAIAEELLDRAAKLGRGAGETTGGRRVA